LQAAEYNGDFAELYGRRIPSKVMFGVDSDLGDMRCKFKAAVLVKEFLGKPLKGKVAKEGDFLAARVIAEHGLFDKGSDENSEYGIDCLPTPWWSGTSEVSRRI
jgi:hypothetical protein